MKSCEVAEVISEKVIPSGESCHWYVIAKPVEPPTIWSIVGVSPEQITWFVGETVPPFIGGVTIISSILLASSHALPFSVLIVIRLK